MSSSLWLWLVFVSCAGRPWLLKKFNNFGWFKLLMSWAWWDWPMTWLTNHRRSVLWHCWLDYLTRKIVSEMTRDQPNSRFHGRDIFHEIGLLPWKTPISVKSVKFHEIRDFSWILMLLLSFMKVFRVLSTAFVLILLFATCHTSALSSWYAFTVLLTYFQSWVLT